MTPTNNSKARPSSPEIEDIKYGYFCLSVANYKLIEFNFLNAQNGYCSSFSAETNDCIRHIILNIKTPFLSVIPHTVN